MNKDFKAIVIVAFLFVTITLAIIAITPSASGYELSIYAAYPWFFWVFTVGSVLCGILILVYCSFLDSKNNSWIFGYLILLLSYSIFLSLPIIRGYALYGGGRGDILVHIGNVKSIMLSGYVPQGIFYPSTSILLTILSYVNIPINSLYLINILLYNLFLIYIYLLVKSIYNVKGQALLAMAFSSPLMLSYFHVSMHPSIISAYLIPIILYCYQRNKMQNRVQFSILILILSLAIIFYHPITTIILIAIFAMFLISPTLYNFLVSNHQEYKKRSVTNIILILFVTFSLWYLSFPSILRGISVVVDWYIVGYDKPSISAYYIQGLAETLRTTPQIVALLIKRYAAIALQFSISLLCIHLILNDIKFKRKVYYEEFSYGIQFISGLFWMAIFIFGFGIEYEPERVIRYAYLFSGVLSSVVIFNKINNLRLNSLVRKASIILVILVVSTSSLCGIFNVFGSPIKETTNGQLTKMYFSGDRWLFLNMNDKIPLLINAFSPDNNKQYLFGTEDAKKIGGRKIDKNIPTHFGYYNNSTIIDYIGKKELYIIITKYDKLAPLSVPINIRASIEQYTDDDFKRLGNDTTYIKLYDNSEFEVWGT